MKVGDVKIDKFGVKWVVSGKWEHKNWTDYSLVNQETGEEGACRDMEGGQDSNALPR